MIFSLFIWNLWLLLTFFFNDLLHALYIFESFLLYKYHFLILNNLFLHNNFLFLFLLTFLSVFLWTLLHNHFFFLNNFLFLFFRTFIIWSKVNLLILPRTLLDCLTIAFKWFKLGNLETLLISNFDFFLFDFFLFDFFFFRRTFFNIFKILYDLSFYYMNVRIIALLLLYLWFYLFVRCYWNSDSRSDCLFGGLFNYDRSRSITFFFWFVIWLSSLFLH